MGQKSYYEIEGKRYERVTTVLGYFMAPSLVDWKLRVGKSEANRIMKEAQKVGTTVHKIAETGKVPKVMSVEVENCVRAYQQWEKETQPNILMRETTVHDSTLGVAGTFDLFIKHNGASVLVDIKTSKEIKLDHWLQLAAYASMMLDNVDTIAVLRLDKNMAFYEFIEKPVYQKEYNVFMDLLNVYRYYNPRGDHDDDTRTTEEEIRGGQKLDKPEIPDAGTVGSW